MLREAHRGDLWGKSEENKVGREKQMIDIVESLT